MATLVLTNAYTLINAVDHSDHVRSVKINYKAETPDNTAMGAVAHSRLPGLKDFDIEIEFNQDYAVANVDEKMFALVGAAAFAIEIRPTTGARSTTNPAYTGNVLLPEYSPLGQRVGDLAVASVKFVGSGTLSRQTS